jgi:hypothetical protein
MFQLLIRMISENSHLKTQQSNENFTFPPCLAVDAAGSGSP